MLTDAEIAFLGRVNGISMAPEAKAKRLEDVERWAVKNAAPGVTVSRGTYKLTVTLGGKRHSAMLGSTDSVEEITTWLQELWPWAWVQGGQG